MKNIGTTAVASLVLLLALSLAPHASGNSDERDNERPAAIIRLVEREHDLVFQDNGAPGPGIGDRLIFTSDLFDPDGHQIGRDGADCVIVRIDTTQPPATQQVVQCVITVQLPEGQLTFQGLAQGTENHFALTGGTGAYRTARGEALVKDVVPLEQADITITLFR